MFLWVLHGTETTLVVQPNELSALPCMSGLVTLVVLSPASPSDPKMPLVTSLDMACSFEWSRCLSAYRYSCISTLSGRMPGETQRPNLFMRRTNASWEIMHP